MEMFPVEVLAIAAGLIYGSIIGSRNVGYESGGVLGVVACLVVAPATVAIGHHVFEIQEKLIEHFFAGIYGVAILGWLAVVMLRKR